MPFAPITAAPPTTAASIQIVAPPPTITPYWGCLNKKGLGWSVVPLWPGDPNSTAAEGARMRYEFSWLSGYGWIEWGTMSVPNQGVAPKGGLAPGSVFTIRAIAISSAGNKSAPSLTVVTAPTDPC